MAIGTTAAILASTAISAGTALASGSKQAKAASQSAAASQAASDQSSATQRYIFDQTRSDNAVRQQAGDAATRQMSSLMGLNLGPQAAAQPEASSAQTYGTGQTGASASYGGRQPRGSIEQRVAAMGDGMVYDGLSGGNTLSTGQYGAAVPVPNSEPAQQAAPTNALTAAQTPTDWLRSTPGYQFNLDEGMRALNTGLAGQGRLESGDAQREAIRYGQNYGDRIYGDQYNRLAGIAGAGQTASSQNQQGGQNYANALTNINQNNAASKASSYQSGANAWTNALGGAAGAGMWGLSQYRGMK